MLNTRRSVINCAGSRCLILNTLLKIKFYETSLKSSFAFNTRRNSVNLLTSCALQVLSHF